MADTKISALPSGAPAQAGDEYVVARSGSNYKLTLTNIAASMPPIGATTPNTGAFTTLSASGNLTFSSTAQRITGDFSNATQSNRLSFQTSTTNGNTAVHALPNGTSQTSAFNVLNNSDPTNASLLQLQVTATEARLNSSITGTGTQLPMTFLVGGERMRLDTSGNLGIGTTSPTSLGSGYQSITTNGTNGSGFVIKINGTDASYIYQNSTALQLVNTQATPIYFFTSNTERARIDASGNVGIGTASPGCKLDVYNSAAAAANNEILRLRYTTSTTAGHSGDLNFANATGTVVGRISSVIEAGGSNSGLAFSTYASGIAQRVLIDGSGNVGIGGTAQAFSKLNVAGTLPVDGQTSVSFYTDATVPSGATSEGQGFRTNLSSAAASFTLSNLRHFYARQGTIGAGSTVTNQFGFFVDSNLTGATNNFGFYSNIASGTNRWNFYAAGTAQNYFAGNTGIGGTPAVRLDVQSAGNEVVKITATTGTNAVYQTMNNTAGSFTVGRENSAGTTFGVEAYSSALFSAGAYPMVFATNNVERMQISSVGNVKIGGTANRATTEGTRQLVLFNGTAPVGTLANGVSFYSASGEANVMDAAGNATLLSPHDSETNEWIFRSKHTPTGRVLKIDVEKMLRFINEHFGLDMVHEFTE